MSYQKYEGVNQKSNKNKKEYITNKTEMETLRAGLQAPEHPCSELTGTVSGLLSSLAGLEQVCSYYRMCSLTIECVLLL